MMKRLKPLAWCIEKLGLQTMDWWADLETKFTIDKWLELAGYSRPRWVVIQLDVTEAGGNWKSGYYFSPLIRIADVKKLLSLDHLGSLCLLQPEEIAPSEDD
jgi:hypothetical protein